MSENNIVTYLADKETLDTVNESVTELKSNLSDVADKDTLDELSSLVRDQESLVNTVNTNVGAIVNQSQAQTALLSGDSSPFGTGYMGDIVVDENFTFPANDIYGRCMIQCKNFTLPAGQTLNVPECSGFYILSQGNITINGTINSRENITEDPGTSVNYFELDGKRYIFANGGVARNYNKTISINKTTLNVNSYTTTPTVWNAQSLTASYNNNVGANHCGGYPTRLSTLSLAHTDGSSTMVIKTNYEFANNTNTYGRGTINGYKLIQNNNIKSSASVILIAKNSITIGNSGVIDTRGRYYTDCSMTKTSGTYTYTKHADFTQTAQVTSSSGWKSYYKFEWRAKTPPMTFTIIHPSASGGITTICNSFINSGKLITNGTKFSTDSMTVADSSINTGLFYGYDGTNWYTTERYTTDANITLTIKGTLGGMTVPSDTIITTPGEIKIYEFGGES